MNSSFASMEKESMYFPMINDKQKQNSIYMNHYSVLHISLKTRVKV